MLEAHWQHIKTVMNSVRGFPPALRDAAIAKACHGDAATIAEIRELLDAGADETLASLFADPAAAVGLPPAALDQPAAVGRLDVSTQGVSGLIGRYVRAEVIGQGRTGVVYRARDLLAQRDVAIKLLRPEMVTADSERRLLAEGRVLARLGHSGIARVLDVGTEVSSGPAGTRGRPYLVIELVDGQDIINFARTRALELTAKLELFCQVCDAVEHAHRSAVLHRDLKPANVLVTTIDNALVVKVLDFGLAKIVDEPHESMLTMPGQVVGTLAYMAPEQAGGDPQQADTRADVYSLGALLYHLLAGHPPISTGGLTLVAAARAIGERTPPLLGTVSRIFRGDLETIAATALAKLPDERYGSASALAADVRNFLAHRPIVAAKPSITYVLARFVQRRRGLTAAMFVAAMCVLAAAVISIQYARRAVVANEQKRVAMATVLNEFVGLQADRIGSSADVRRVLGIVVSQMQPLVESDGNDARVLSDYATLLSRLADVEQADRQLELAQRHAAAAWDMRSRLAAMSPDDPELRADVSIATVRRGDLAAQLGNRAEADRLYDEAMRIDEALHAAHPKSRKFLSNLVYSYERAAYASIQAQRFEEANQFSARQVELVDLLTQSAPAMAANMWAKATARANRAAVLDNLHLRSESRVLRGEQLTLASQLVKLSPGTRRYRVMAAGLSARASAEKLLPVPTLSESAALATAAIDHLEMLLSAGETDQTTLWAEVATLEFLTAAPRLHEPDRLLNLIRRSVERTAALAANAPNSYEMMAQSRLLLAKLFRRTGEIDAAAEHEAAGDALARESLLADTWVGDETPMFLRECVDKLMGKGISVQETHGLKLKWTSSQPASLERVRIVCRTLALLDEIDLACELLRRAATRLPEAARAECEKLHCEMLALKK